MTQHSFPFRFLGPGTLALALGITGCASHREMTANKPATAVQGPETAKLAARRARTEEAVAAKAEQLRQNSQTSRPKASADTVASQKTVPNTAPRKSSQRETSASNLAATNSSPAATEAVKHVSGSELDQRVIRAGGDAASSDSFDPIPDEPMTPDVEPAVAMADESTAPTFRPEESTTDAPLDPVATNTQEPGTKTTEASVAADPVERPRLSDRLKIPQELPGAAVPPLRLPKYDIDDAAARDKAIEGLFPELPHAEQIPAGEQPPMKLEDFEQLALAYNPKVTQAVAEVQSASGNAVQAGLYPNPTVGYQADTVGSGGTANYHGVFVQQTIVTANKLGLARASAMFEIYNAQLKLQRTRVEVLTDVRTAYYDLLIARETVRIYEALVRFTDQAYRVQVEQLKGGQAAAYEPMQLRAQSRIARTALALAKNRYAAAARQLAAAVSMPEMQAAELADVADAVVPKIEYQLAVDHMLAVHPDLSAANNSTLQAQTNVERARVVPIPNVGFYSAIQKDFTDPTHRRTTWNMQVGVPVPIFDRNQGAIHAAEGDYIRATYESTRVRNDLIRQLADAFRRYENANTLVETYRNEIIPDQSRVYRAVYERHQQEPDVVGFGDIVVAQQTLQQSITAYAEALGQRWTALVEIEQLLQIEDGTQLVPLLGEPLPAPDEGVPTPVPQP